MEVDAVNRCDGFPAAQCERPWRTRPQPASGDDIVIAVMMRDSLTAKMSIAVVFG